MLVESVDIANGEVAAATLDAQMAQVTISAKSFASSIDATDQVVQSVTIYSDGNAITSFGDGDSYTAFVEPNDNEAYGETFVVIGFGESSATSSYKSTYTPVLAAAGVYNFAYDITANGDITAWDGETKTAPTVGDGSVSSPYEVSTAAELAYFQDYIASTFHIKITADIDLGYNSWTPIGTSTTSMNVFFGSCDGGGYTIYGLKVNSDPSLNDGQYTSSLYRGLFSLIDVQEFDSNNCTLSNINIENAIVYANNPEEGTYEYQGYGILCGMAQAKTLSGTKRVPVIDNCHVSGTIYCTSNSYAAGGLVGNTNEVVIKNSSADVTITGSSSSVGGLVGYGFGVQISDCTASGSISGTWCVGGLVGVAEGYSSSDVTITDSKSYTNVTATNWNVGGFIGFNYATITNCYAYGDVYSNVNFSDDITRTGGFVGCNYEDGSSISNSGFEGTLSGLESDSCYGGFVGYCFGGSSITNCYFDSSKNPSLNSNGESSYNDTDSYTNSISNTVPTL